MYQIEIKCTPHDAPLMRVFADPDRDTAVSKAVQAFKDRGWKLPDTCYIIQRSWTCEVWMPREAL